MTTSSTISSRRDLYQLMSITDAAKYCGMTDISKTVSELLSAYSVGTESAKAPPSPPTLGTSFYRCENIVSIIRRNNL